ncbi:MAG TPA: GntR family transcriptional regulator [Opitutaceae bacterium]|nr:GntR family transcriptional regulator [Opitutaceae bacterium]
MKLIIRPSLVEISPDIQKPTTLPDHVYTVLKQRILSCALPPNDRLVEKSLCDDLQVSRTPLREALNRLCHEGLVVLQAHAGYRVAPITLESFRSLIELRALIEPQAAALAAERATAEEAAVLRDRAQLPFDPNDDQSFVEYCRANARFHLLVVRAARNPLLENIVMSALDMYQRPTYMRIGRQMDLSNPSAKHVAIAEAIANHDAGAARATMQAHVLGGGERILAALAEAGYK